MIYFIVATLAVFLLNISIYYFLDYRKEKQELKRKFNDFYNKGEKRSSMIVMLGDRYDRSERAKPLYEKLENANLPFTPSEYIGALIVSYLGIVFLLQKFFNIKFTLSLIIAGVLVEITKRLIFLFRKNQLKQKMLDQLPEVCRLLANSTRAGMTLNQGVQLVSNEVNQPAKGEFRQLAYELSLGVDFGKALKSMEKRINSQEFNLFVATLLIQKKAGGNLFSVLDEMSQMLEERKLLKQEIKTMTAEQRYVSYLVPVIPIILVLMMNNIVDGFLDPLFTGIGLVLLLFFLGGTILTFLLVRKVTNIRV